MIGFEIATRVRETLGCDVSWNQLAESEKIQLILNEGFKPNDTVYFLKSGNAVRLIEKSASKEDAWTVERIDGLSKGKKLFCLTRALSPFLPGDESEFLTNIESR